MDLEGLDFSSVSHMRPPTQVDQRSAPAAHVWGENVQLKAYRYEQDDCPSLYTQLRRSPVNGGSRRGDLLVQNATLELVVLWRRRGFGSASKAPSLQ